MKNTKPVFLLLLAAAALVFAAGCSDGSESDGSSSSLIGTWKDENGYTYVFNSGGTFTDSYGNETAGGNWSLSGSTLTSIVSEGGYSRTFVYSVTFSGDTMTLEPISGTITTGGQTTNITADQMATEIWTRVS